MRLWMDQEHVVFLSFFDSFFLARRGVNADHAVHCSALGRVLAAVMYLFPFSFFRSSGWACQAIIYLSTVKLSSGFRLMLCLLPFIKFEFTHVVATSVLRFCA